MNKPKLASRKQRFLMYLDNYYEKKTTGYFSLAISTIVAAAKFCFGYLVYSSLWMYSGSYSAAGVITLLVAALFQARQLKRPERCYWLASAVMCLRAITFDIYIMNRSSAFQAVWITDKRFILVFEAVILFQYLVSIIGLAYSKNKDRPIVASVEWLQLSNALINSLLFVHLILPFFYNQRADILHAKLFSNFIFAAAITAVSIYMVYRSIAVYRLEKAAANQKLATES